MADTFFIEGLNTLPEQVQINKDNIKTNTDNIQKLGDLSDTYHEQIHSLNTQVATNTADIDNLSKKVYDNGTSSFQIEKGEDSKDYFTFKNDNNFLKIYIIKEDPFNELYWAIRTNNQGIYFTSAVVFYDEARINRLYVNHNISGANYVDWISDSDSTDKHHLLTANSINTYYLHKSEASSKYLTKTDASNTYLTKTDASTTYATKTELSNANKRIDALDTGTFDVDLTTAGLAKIKANVTIGTSITLTKDTDFSEYLDYTGYKTVIFTLYIDNNEKYFISTDIKLDVGDTADVYGDNDQNYTWLTGIGVIKLGPDISGSNYLCYISYSQGYTSPLVITPIQKLA